MALDRTWYNTLVDDDGSGLTGSVWDKADVDALMDAIDAELARVAAKKTAWTPTITNAAGTVQSTGALDCHYAVVGDQLFYRVKISTYVPTATAHIRITTPPGFVCSSNYVDETSCRIFDNVVSHWGYLAATSAGRLEAYRDADAAFAAGTTYYIIGSGFYFIA